MPPRSWARRALIVFCALLAYGPTLRLGFIWDDYYNVETKASLRAWTVENVKQDFSKPLFILPDGHGLYRPLQSFTHRMEYTLWKLKPAGYHAVNLLLHIGNALLAAQLATAIGVSAGAALLVGCLFGAHPIIVQELLMASGRSELMSLFLMFASALFFLRQRKGSLILALLAYGLALFTKESAILTSALIALLLAYRGDKAAAYKPLAWFLLPTIVYALFYRMALSAPSFPIDAATTVRFFGQAFPAVIVHYIALLFWPWPLYTDRLLPHWNVPWVAAPIGLTLVVGFLIAKRQSLALMGLAWFVITLLPKSFLMLQQSLILDHWAYAGLWGILVPFSVAACHVFSRAPERRKFLGPLLAATAVFLLAVVTQANIQLRGTNEKFYRWATRFPTSETMKSNLAFLLVHEKRFNEALPLLQALHEEYPGNEPVNQALMNSSTK